MTLGAGRIRALLDERGLSPSRALGQNFLVDPNTARRIAGASGAHQGDHVLEVGPGLGSLTLALVELGAHVTAVELDRHLVPVLREVVADADPPVTVVHGDALEVDLGALLAASPRWLLAANLPYNVAVPALLHLLAEFPTIRSVMVMVQAEVAERLAADPGGKDYGVPSAKVRFYGNVRRYGMVSPTVFWPIPRVYSGLVRIDRYETSPWPTDADFRAQVFDLVDIGFAQRRKTSRNAFAEWAGSGNESARRLLAASIDPSRRGETLAIADFVRLLKRSGETEEQVRVL